MKDLHPKIQELRLKASPFNRSGMYIDASGSLYDVPDLKIKSTLEGAAGYLTVWGVRDTFGTIPIKGCFAKSIRERGPDSESKQKIAFLWQHRSTEPIGRFTKLIEDEYGLYFEAVYDDIPEALRAAKQILSGTINQFSYGFDYVWDKMEYDSRQDAVLMYEVCLMEGSPVTFGSCDETYALRSIEDYQTKYEELAEHIEDFIKSVPRSKQLELRQLFARHKTLISIKPDELTQNPLNKDNKPDEHITVIGGYKLNLNEF